MSRGLGKVQQLCLSVLQEHGQMLDSIEIAGRALDKMSINDSEDVSFRRALRQLRVRGLVVDMGRGFRDGRRRWALPETARRYFERFERCFGRQQAMSARRASRFTPDHYPDHA